MHLNRFSRTPDIATFLDIGEGRDAVYQTLKQMRRLVREGRIDPEIRACALAIVQHVPGKDWVGEISQLFAWVRDNVRYVRDVQEVETLQTPRKTLELLQGDCDDQATLLATLLACIDHPSRFVACGFDSDPDMLSHVFVQARVGNGWMSLDTTEPMHMGWEPPDITDRCVVHV